jgi:MFS family permease
MLPLAFAAYQTTMVLGRVIGDHTVRRFGAAAVVRAGAVVAALGLLGVVLAPSPGLAIVAFALTGLGFCVVPPQCFSATSKLDPTGSGIAISRVNVFNYAGFVLGAALVGGIAGGVPGSAGWRAAFAAPLALTTVIVVLARDFNPQAVGSAAGEGGRTAEAGTVAPG